MSHSSGDPVIKCKRSLIHKVNSNSYFSRNSPLFRFNALKLFSSGRATSACRGALQETDLHIVLKLHLQTTEGYKQKLYHPIEY